MNLNYSPECYYNAKEYNLESVEAALRLQLAGFSFDGEVEPAQCILLQMKVVTNNETERDFIREVFQETSDNSTGDWIAQLNVDPRVAAMQLNAPLSTDVERPLPEPLNSTCSNSSCLFEGISTQELFGFFDSENVTLNNSCELLKNVYGCEVDGCGCDWPQCDDATECNGHSCDDYPWTSCSALEQWSDCDCSGCRCKGLLLLFSTLFWG